ncbi:MAG: glycosyltransferase [Anaerolineales bacterium]
MTASQGRGRSLNVLQIIGDLNIGGAQEVVRTLVKYMNAMNAPAARPVVCSFKDGPLRRDIEQLGIDVHILPDRRYSVLAFPWFLGDMMRIWRALTQIVRQYDIDVVQTHLLRTLDFLVLLLKYTTAVRAVFWTFHSAQFRLAKTDLAGHTWLLGPKRFVHHLLYKWASRFVDGFIAVSDQVGDAITETIRPVPGKVIVICNGVDIEQYERPGDPTGIRSELGLEETARLIALVGTLKEGKGHPYMIQAMPAIVARHPSAHALFIGDGALREALKSQAAALHVDAHIHFLGSRRDVPALLAASDLFVLPSLWEGLSMALLEALATGLPVVASEVSGTVQVITSEEMGRLTPPGDVPQLTAAISQLLSDPQRAQAMGLAGKRRATAAFSAQVQVDEHLSLYHHSLDEA